MKEMSRELEEALKAAREAGDIMDKYVSSEIEVVDRKSEQRDLVTEADMRCQEAVVEHLKDRFPDHGFLAEEDDLRPEGESKVWVIDPIDGTFNFSKKFPYFCCSIGLREEGEMKLGVVLSPGSALGKYWFAERGEGSYRASLDQDTSEAEKISVSECGIEGARIAAGYSDMESRKREFDGGKINSLLRKGAAYSRPGSAALNACMIASGRLDGWIGHVSEWDFAAGKVIVEEAGGILEHRYIESNGLHEVVASNGKIQETLRDHGRLDWNP